MRSKIISEIGVNWDRDLSLACKMIKLSAEAGADFVKFQMFNEEVIRDSPYFERLKFMIVNSSILELLAKEAYKNEIGFGISVMYPEAIKIVESIDSDLIDFLKIRCQDNCNEEIAILFSNYCIKNKKLLFVSTQHSPHEYFNFNLYSKAREKGLIRYLYCIPEYPPILREIRIDTPGLFHGYSNHYPDKFVPMTAIARGFEYIEIHTTNTFDYPCIDNKVSLDFDELKEICKFRDIVSQLKGD